MSQPWQLPYPESNLAMLLYAQTVLVWLIANYINRDPTGAKEARKRTVDQLRKWHWFVLVRSGVASFVVFALPWFSNPGGAFLLAGFTLVGCVFLPLVRQYLAKNPRGCKFGLEWEIGLNVVYVFVVLQIIGAFQMTIIPIVELPISEQQFISTLIYASTYILMIRPGTHIVRQLLDKLDANPEESTHSQLIIPRADYEIKRGQMIGNLERLILLTVVLMGEYAALGFLVAAKGLIRIREFEDRNFAEYFIIGTLTSVLVAIGVGILTGFLLTK